MNNEGCTWPKCFCGYVAGYYHECYVNGSIGYQEDTDEPD